MQIRGSGFLAFGAAAAAIPVFLAPNQGVTNLSSVIVSDVLVETHFVAGAEYQPKSVVLAPAGHPPLAFVMPDATCQPKDVDLKYQVTPYDQAKNKYGNGLAKNYHIVQITIVNKCAKKIVVPLGGLTIGPEWHHDSNYEDGPAGIAPFSLQHVISIFNTDRTVTGSRAIMFNIIQATATIGSAVEQFFAPGFTQGVSILGGGFRNSVLEISKDRSSEQLKALTDQSFETSELVGPNGGSLQKYVFITRNDVKLPNKRRQRIDDLKRVDVTWFIAGDETQKAQASNARNLTK